MASRPTDRPPQRSNSTETPRRWRVSSRDILDSRPVTTLTGFFTPLWMMILAGLPGVPVQTATDVSDRNAHRLYADMLWSAVFLAVTAFNGAFTLRLGGSNELVGLLSSAPPLVVALLTMPASRLVQRSQNRARLIAISVFFHRMGYLLIAVLPFLLLTGRAEAFVAVIVVMTIPAALVNVAFTSTFADVVPEDRRATVVSVRAILSSAMVMAVTPLFGLWLDRTRFPENYQAIYLVGFLTSLFVVQALVRLEAPPLHLAEVPARPEDGKEGLARRGVKLFAENPAFARIVLNTFVHGCGVWLIAPLLIIYYVRYLHASDSWIGTLIAVSSLSAAVGYWIWRKIIGRIGEDIPLRIGIPGAGLFPLAVGLSGSLDLILVFAAINGLIQPGGIIAHFNTLLKVCPSESRPTFIGLYTTIMNFGAFLCPLLGVFLLSQIGPNAAILLGAAFWISGGMLFSLLPVRPVVRFPAVLSPPTPIVSLAEGRK